MSIKASLPLRCSLKQKPSISLVSRTSTKTSTQPMALHLCVSSTTALRSRTLSSLSPTLMMSGTWLTKILMTEI